MTDFTTFPSSLDVTSKECNWLSKCGLGEDRPKICKNSIEDFYVSSDESGYRQCPFEFDCPIDKYRSSESLNCNAHSGYWWSPDNGSQSNHGSSYANYNMLATDHTVKRSRDEAVDCDAGYHWSPEFYVERQTVSFSTLIWGASHTIHQIFSAPDYVQVPCILGVDLTDGDLLEFLQQLAETDGSSIMPPSVLPGLNFKACRGAIMFGDSLLPSECSLLVEELKKSKLCSQCAHGRPTTTPLVNLDELHKQVKEFSMLDGRSNHPWHGLHRHEIDLKRTTDRLHAALR